MPLTVKVTGIEEMKALARTFRTPALRALNKVGRSAEVAANRKIRETYNMRRADVDREITIKPASIGNLTVTITAKGKRIPLIDFAPRQTAEGVTVQVKRAGRKLIPHSFIATMPTGHKGVFRRLTRARLPIEELTTLSVAQAFGSKEVEKTVQSVFFDTLPRVLDHEIEYWKSQRR